MKAIAASLLLTLPVFAAADPSLLEFGGTPFRLPPLTLRDAAREALPPVFRSPAAFVAPPTALKPRLVLKLRVIVPKTNPDPAMIVTPDPSIDYKMRIIVPPGSEAPPAERAER